MGALLRTKSQSTKVGLADRTYTAPPSSEPAIELPDNTQFLMVGLLNWQRMPAPGESLSHPFAIVNPSTADAAVSPL